MSTLTFAVFGRGPKGKSMAITDVVDLPMLEDVKDGPKFNEAKYKDVILDNDASIEDQLAALEKMQESQMGAKKAFSALGGKGLSKQDQVRAIGIKYLLENYGNEISLEDRADRFLIKEAEIELTEDKHGNFTFELATVFGREYSMAA